MFEDNKTKLFHPLLIIIVVFALIWGGYQLRFIERIPRFFEYYTGFERFSIILFRISSLVVPIVVLVSLLLNKYSISLIALIIYYIACAIILFPKVFFTTHLAIAILLILLLLKKINISAALSVCSMLDFIYVVAFVLDFRLHWEILVSVLPPVVILSGLLCCLYMEEKDNEKSSYKHEPDAAAGGYTTGTDTNQLIFEKRNIFLCIILSIVTFGIYGICWLLEISRDVYQLHGSKQSAVGEVLLILLVPFYSCYWMYKTGKQIYEDSQKYGVNANNNAIMYLVLALFGFQIVNYALIQNEFNNFEAEKTPQNRIGSDLVSNEPNVSGSSLALLEELRIMKDSGLITEAEYNKKKQEILSRM